jgi:hypothetical protein
VRLGEKLPGFLGRLLRLGAGTVDARYLFPQVELVAVACSVFRSSQDSAQAATDSPRRSCPDAAIRCHKTIPAGGSTLSIHPA